MSAPTITYEFELSPALVRGFYTDVLGLDPCLSLSVTHDVLTLSGGNPDMENTVKALIGIHGGRNINVSYEAVSTSEENVVEASEASTVEIDALVGGEISTEESGTLEEAPEEAETPPPVGEDPSETAPKYISVVVKITDGEPRHMVEQGYEILRALSGHMCTQQRPRWWRDAWCLYLGVESTEALAEAIKLIEGCKVSFSAE